MKYLKNEARSILQKAESFLKIDTVYITKGGFWTTFRFLTGTGASIVTMIAFGNLITKEAYGIYSYILSLAGSLAFLTLSGIGPGVTRNVALGNDHILPYVVKLQIKYNLLSTIIIGLAGIYYQAKGNAVFAISLGILAIVIPLETSYHVFEHALIGKKRFDLIAIIGSLSNIGATVATVITLILTDSVLALVLSYGLMSLGPTLLSYWWVQSKLPKKNVSDELKSSIKHAALHITGAGIIGTIAQYIDKIIIFQIAGPASLAVYGFAIAGPERLKGLLKNWMVIILPRLSERSVQDIRNSFYPRLGLSVFAGMMMSLAYILFSPVIFKLLLPKYLDSIFYSQVYSLGLIVIPIMIYIGNIFYSQNMLRAIYLSSTGIQILRILLFLVFGWLWQTWGLVMAFLSSQFLSALYCIFIWEYESRRLNKKNHV